MRLEEGHGQLRQRHAFGRGERRVVIMPAKTSSVPVWLPLRAIRMAYVLATIPLYLMLSGAPAAGQLSLPLTRPAPVAPAAADSNESAKTKALEAKLAEARANLAADEAAGESAVANAPAGISAQD